MLRRQFGWRPHTGAPRIVLSVDGQRLEAGGQEVMQFNKEGRDGFPWKVGGHCRRAVQYGLGHPT